MDYCANMAPIWRQYFFLVSYNFDPRPTQIREGAHVLWVGGYGTEWRQLPQLFLAAENGPFYCALDEMSIVQEISRRSQRRRVGH